MRRLLAVGMMLALVVGCDTGTPEPTLYAPDDLASVLPHQVGDLTLQVEGSSGSEHLAETLESILKTDVAGGFDPDKTHFAFASSNSDPDEPRLLVWAVRVEGVPAGDLGGPDLDFLWEELADKESWGSDPWWLASELIGEVMFGAVVTSKELGITYEEVKAALPTCQRKGKEYLQPCRAPS